MSVFTTSQRRRSPPLLALKLRSTVALSSQRWKERIFLLLTNKGGKSNMNISRFSNIFTLQCSGSGKSPSGSGVRNRIGAEEDFNLAHRGNPRHLPDQARASSPRSWCSGELRFTSNYVKMRQKSCKCNHLPIHVSRREYKSIYEYHFPISKMSS